MDNCITVSCTATAEVAPDAVEIRMSATGEGKRSAAAVAECERVQDGACKALAVLGVTAKREGMQVHPVYRDGKLSCYRAAATLFIRRELPFDFDALADGLGECGAGWQVNFVRKDIDEVRKDLIRRAVSDAICDARTIAEAAGVKLGALCGVDYSPACSPAMLRAARAEVEIADIRLSETVTCSFKIS